jgi:GTP-binding protein Era
VRGIVTRADAQLILVDTPGLHRPRTLLGERLNDVVRTTLAEVDVIGFCVPADEKIGPGDRFIAAELAELRAPVVAIVTKTDLASRQQVAAQLVALNEFDQFTDIVPVSAVAGDQVDLLADLLVRHLPEGPLLYPDDVTTDNDIVTIDELRPRARRPDLTEIFATIHLERDSQKGIVIGHQGSRLKHIGTTARAGIEVLLGGKVHLGLHVAVEADWQRDPKKLDRLGF